MAREPHPATWFKVRHRVTGLYYSHGRDINRWNQRGRVFKNQGQVRKFLLKTYPDIPHDWEVVPIELTTLEHEAMNAKAWVDHLLRKLVGKETRAKLGLPALPPKAEADIPPWAKKKGTNADEKDAEEFVLFTFAARAPAGPKPGKG